MGQSESGTSADRSAGCSVIFSGVRTLLNGMRFICVSSTNPLGLKSVFLRGAVCTVPVFALAILLQCSFGESTSPPPGILVRLDESAGVVVEYSPEPRGERQALQGIWFDLREGRSRYLRLPVQDSGNAALSELQLAALGGTTRGDAGADGQAVTMSLAALDQLASGEIVRAITEGGFLTPVDQGVHLSPRITLRRVPRKSDPKYPAETLMLVFGSSRFEFAFPEGVSRLAWDEIPDRPDSLKAGLPPGRYLLRMQGCGAESVFHVLSEEETRGLRQRMQVIESSALPTRAPALADQMLIQLLMQSTAPDGSPVSFLADVCDLLDQPHLSASLQQMKSDLVARLTGEDDTGSSAPDDLSEINWARDLIARGQWQRAVDILQSPEARQSSRSARLADLYLGVALAESSLTLGGEAEAAFRSTLEGIDSVDQSDAFRIHHNYGNFLFRNIQNGLNNHSLRAASGAAEPLFTLLLDWRRAADEYEQALAISQRISPEAENAARVSLARLYSLLSDVLFVVNSTMPDAEKLPALESSASRKSMKLAETALASSSSDLATRAAAAETLAQLEHRQGHGAACRKYAQQALESYLAMGSLVGAEGIFRLHGLSWLSEKTATETEAKPIRQAALEDLGLSHLLAEFLRQQYPGDTIGLSRAGFLARRAYVTGRMVELLMEEEEFGKALEILETSKARALQDLFAAGSLDATPGDSGLMPLSQLLADWPAQTVCLEYFLGTEQAWVFCIREGGQVTACRLRDAQGQPLRTAELIARIRLFLNQMEGAAGKMLRATSPSQPFDGRWQEDLHRFWKELLPKEIAGHLVGNRNVIMIPQHLLHYFPFAALVTEMDTARRGPMESVMPKFWIESGIDLTYAPSLSTWRVLRSQQGQVATQVHGVGIASFVNANPLPGVKSDLANLQRHFGDLLRSSITGTGVNEQKLRESMSQPGMVFLGTHGANRPDQPLASYLLCHSDSENDGFFMAGEIYRSRFQSCIAILSACYSGLADRSPLAGDDLFGIERALLHSGVKTVIDGIWDVYDATGTEIMDHVFESLRQGARTPEAVARAQRKFLQDRRLEGPGDPWIHPYFWAVYKVSGSDLTAVSPPAPVTSQP